MKCPNATVEYTMCCFPRPMYSGKNVRMYSLKAESVISIQDHFAKFMFSHVSLDVCSVCLLKAEQYSYKDLVPLIGNKVAQIEHYSCA